MDGGTENIIPYVDALIHGAIAVNASDIHFELRQEGARLRYRIDGILYDQHLECSSSKALQIVARIKVLSHINIAERRNPQDGKFLINYHNRSIDLRVSTFPSLYGEKLVIRILDRGGQRFTLNHLGFRAHILQQFNHLITRNNGFLLVTGPTGSGKTTTLYAVLSQLNDATKHIITLEDPIEYNIEGITQGQIHHDIGFSFERGIRSLLRQDPDIAMIGEIRDKESARIAIEAALTGHLVLSTLHTNDAPSAIIRLMDMGIEPYLINASVSGVLAQRLARALCGHCKKEIPLTDQEQYFIAHHQLAITHSFGASGCEQCSHRGYKGRIGIFELLLMTNRLRSLIISNPIIEDVYRQALNDGMQTLLMDGAHKVNEGFISFQELMRVIA